MAFPRPIDDSTAQCHFSVEYRRIPFTPLGSNRQITAKGSTRCRARKSPSSPDQEATLLIPSMPLLEANNRTSRQGNRIPPQKGPQPTMQIPSFEEYQKERRLQQRPFRQANRNCGKAQRALPLARPDHPSRRADFLRLGIV
jgi:hypothetical protein